MGTELSKTTFQNDFQTMMNATQSHKVLTKNWVWNYFWLFYWNRKLTIMDFDCTNMIPEMIISYITKLMLTLLRLLNEICNLKSLSTNCYGYLKVILTFCEVNNWFYAKLWLTIAYVMKFKQVLTLKLPLYQQTILIHTPTLGTVYPWISPQNL